MDDFKIGITAGVFDLLHTGHLLMLKYCKTDCDYLIVCVQVDPSRYREGKERPIETIFERTVRLESCKHVDRVIVYETEEDLESILSNVQYDVRYIGDDHRGHSFTGDTIRQGTFHYNPRDHKYSSSALKDRVVNGRKEPKRPKPVEVKTGVVFSDEEYESMDEYIGKKTRKARKGKK